MGSSLSFLSASDDDVSLEGLEQELQDYKTDDVCYTALCLFMMFVICPYLCCLLGFLLFATEGSYYHTVARHSIEELHQGC